MERAKRKPTQSLDAYDYYLRALASFDQGTRESTSKALQLLYRAIDLDPDFASPHATAVRCMGMQKARGWTTDHAYDIAEAQRLAERPRPSSRLVPAAAANAAGTGRARGARVFAATLVRNCYGLSGCWPPCTDQTGLVANGGFYFQAFDACPLSRASIGARADEPPDIVRTV
jgi:hypothetical protein